MRIGCVCKDGWARAEVVVGTCANEPAGAVGTRRPEPRPWCPVGRACKALAAQQFSKMKNKSGK